ncbi:lytic transglycosylase domain-containing protein [Brevundimonas naejangsanensis]|uniref:lytic transglycosylase domain-containing protein n=1 Tax=Brevundimonas naejangsanensis TaxID=588932 RepID=UPI00320873C7
MLDLAAVLLLSQTCAPGVAPGTLAAIAHVESRFDPLAIGINRGPRPSRRARTAQEAATVARDLIARGGNVDLGLAQINSANLGWLRLSVEDAFDPCRNLEAAGVVLRDGYRPRGQAAGERQRALRVALSRYNTGDASRGFRNGYVGKVETAAIRLNLALHPPSPPAAPAPSPELTPSLPPPSWDVFAHARAVLVFSPAPARSPT